MRELYKYITESTDLRPVVIYGGKFQPFHSGHYEIYEKLVKEFGVDNVFICTTDLSQTRRNQKSYRENHIFSFQEKKMIMTTMFSIPEKQIFCAKRTPYLPSWTEIPVKGSNYAFITIAGEKDGDRFKELGGGMMKVQEYTPGMTLESCLTHKYFYHVGNEKVHLSATDVRNFFRDEKDEDKKKAYFKKVYGEWNEKIYNLINNRINYITESMIVVEGGVCGHIQHLYNDLDITFDDLNDIIDLGFSSNLESSVEKVDGQPLAMTYRDGKFLFAYKDLPKSIDELELELFKDLPKKIYRQSCERLVRAFQNLPQTSEWFSGNKLLQMEIISSEMPNMIKYNRDALIFHYMVEYDEKGKAINKDREIAQIIADQIDNSSENIKVIGPPRLKMKDIDFTDVKTRLKEDLKKLHNSISDDSSVWKWLVHETELFLKKHDIDVPDKVEVITKKWLGLNKTHTFSERNYKDTSTREKLIELDTKEGPLYINNIYNDFKVLVTRICIEILRGLQSYVATDIEDGSRAMKTVLRDAIKELQGSGELDSIGKLHWALDRINKLGGEDALFPSEGIIFNYKDKIYKITGMFADYIALSDIIRTKMKNNEYNIS